MTVKVPSSRQVTLSNKRGLHARASAKFVECAGQFDAQIIVRHDGHEAGGTSILSLMMLAAPVGSTLALEADGADADAALDALEAMINDKFDEGE